MIVTSIVPKMDTNPRQKLFRSEAMLLYAMLQFSVPVNGESGASSSGPETASLPHSSATSAESMNTKPEPKNSDSCKSKDPVSEQSSDSRETAKASQKPSSDARQSAEASPQQTSDSEPQLADDTIILLLTPGADMDRVAEIIKGVHATITRTLHVNQENYSILFIKPEDGKADETCKKLLEQKDKNFRSIARNYLVRPGQ